MDNLCYISHRNWRFPCDNPEKGKTMSDRLADLLEIARSGDDDVALQVASEIALMPQAMSMKMQKLIEAAEEYSAEFAPVQESAPDAVLDQLADEAGF